MPPPDMNPFMGQYDPNASIFTGGSPIQAPNLGFPIPGLGPLSPFGGMALQGILQSLAPSQTFVFSGQQSYLDALRYRQQMRDMMASTHDASRRDAARFRQTFEGGLRMAGATNEYLQRPEVRGWLDRGQAMGASMMPMLGMMAPEIVDRLGGYRGFESIMATQMYMGGRFMADPVTGGPGWSPTTTRAVADSVYGRLYGTEADVMRMRGLGAGQAGVLFREMSLRGLTGGQGDRSWTELPETSRTRMATGVSDRIRDMAGSVAAIRDIFGDMGQPDAPMRQLIEGLNALTQGGLDQMRPDRVRTVVRNMRELARMSGVSSGALFALQSQAGAGADALGLSRAFAVDATQGALAYAQAASDVGLTGTNAFGALSKEQILATDQRLRLQAAASPAANFINAVLYASEAFSGVKGYNKEGELEKFAQAARTGDAKYINAQGALTTDRLAQMFRDSGAPGLNENMAYQLFGSPEATRRLGAEHDTASIVRSMQRNDVSQKLRRAFGETYAQYGFGNQAEALADRAVAAYWATDPAKANTPAGLAAAMGIDVNDPIYAATVAGQASAVNWTGSQQVVNLQMFGERAAERTTQLRKFAGNRGILADALSGMGQGGYLRNLVEYITNAGTDATITGMAAATFGGLKSSDARTRLTNVLAGNEGKFQKALLDFTALAGKADTTPAAMKAAADEVNRQLGPLHEQFGKEIGAESLDYEPLPPEEALKQYTELRGGKLSDAKRDALLKSIKGLSYAGGVGFHKRLAAGQYLQTLIGTGKFMGMTIPTPGRTLRDLSADELGTYQKQIEDVLPGSFEGLRELTSGDPGALTEALDKEGAQHVQLAPGSVVGLEPNTVVGLKAGTTIVVNMEDGRGVVVGDGSNKMGGAV